MVWVMMMMFSVGKPSSRFFCSLFPLSLSLSLFRLDGLKRMCPQVGLS